MTLLNALQEGQTGLNIGLPMGEGLEDLERLLNGIQKSKITSLAAPPKGGKSTLADYGFVISPSVYVLTHNYKVSIRINELNLLLTTTEDQTRIVRLEKEIKELYNSYIYFKIIYNSYEIDRISKEFDFVSHFLFKDYGLRTFELPPGKTYDKKRVIEISSLFLRGELCYDQLNEKGEKEFIPLTQDLVEKVKIIYQKWIIPLFGEYNENGVRISEGIIDFRENKDNPTGVRNYLLNYAEKNGTFINDVKIKDDGTQVTRKVGYIPNNPKLITLVVTDHLRKLTPERGFNKKETIDKFSEYAVDLRNLCKFSFLHIIHLNRALADVARRKAEGDRIFPTSDDIKDTGNLSEDSNYILTMFNPNDDKLFLNKHFGLQIRNTQGQVLYPNLRTIHLVESRHGLAPRHLRVNMEGGIKNFVKFS